MPPPRCDPFLIAASHQPVSRRVAEWKGYATADVFRPDRSAAETPFLQESSTAAIRCRLAHSTATTACLRERSTEGRRLGTGQLVPSPLRIPVWLARLLERLAEALRAHAARAQLKRERNVYYRTKDGRADYRFSIERQPDGTYRAFIVSQPSYGSRATGAHETHRLRAWGRYYVCWNRPLRTPEDALSVAALWADATQEYIRSGRRF
jgi:hypothetical protein